MQVGNSVMGMVIAETKTVQARKGDTGRTTTGRTIDISGTRHPMREGSGNVRGKRGVGKTPIKPMVGSM